MNEELRNALDGVESPVRRKLLFLGWLNEQIARKGYSSFPILVGGSAVAFYTGGNYATQDIDLVYSSAIVDEVLLPAGFKKEGRYWFDESIGILVECPGSTYLGKVAKVRVRSYEVYVSSIEDMIVDRLCAFVFWESRTDGEWARLMLASDDIDRTYLSARAKEEGVDGALFQLAVDMKLSEEGPNA